jgi:ribosomal protein S18 acetylase RimI-like enzyme
MKISLSEINLRPITEEDKSFLCKVYISSREDEMGIRDWEEKERSEFLQNQFNMQHTYYMKSYKNPSFKIVLLGNVAIGRLYVERNEKEIRIIDISILKEYRGFGIGRELINCLIEESENKNIELTLHVEYYNFAKQWYKKIGFKQHGENGVYVFMIRAPKINIFL